jgi:hypothetical protein
MQVHASCQMPPGSGQVQHTVQYCRPMNVATTLPLPGSSNCIAIPRPSPTTFPRTVVLCGLRIRSLHLQQCSLHHFWPRRLQMTLFPLVPVQVQAHCFHQCRAGCDACHALPRQKVQAGTRHRNPTATGKRLGSSDLRFRRRSFVPEKDDDDALFYFYFFVF